MKMNKLIDLNLLRQFKTNLDRKITKLDEEQDKKVEAALEEVNGRVEDLSANFTMAADEIGDAIAAFGVTVPQGSTLNEMADIIKTHLRKKVSYISKNGGFGVTINCDHDSYSGNFSFGYTFPGIPKITGTFGWDNRSSSVTFYNVTRSGAHYQFNASTGSKAGYGGWLSWQASYSDS